MKNKTILMAVTAAALLTACESLELQSVVAEEPAPKAEVTFTANVGADTKTYLEYRDGVYKNLWSDYDEIAVIDLNTSDGEWCSIVSGAGTTSATFTGTILSDNYLAYYGAAFQYYDSSFSSVDLMPYIYPTQWMDYDYIDGDLKTVHGGDRYPMVATSSTNDFNFKNLASILKFNIKADGENIKYVLFEPNDSTMIVSGPATLDYSNSGEPVMTMCDIKDENYSYILLYVEETLNGEGEYSIVLPAGTYKGGFTLTIVTDSGYMDVSTTADIVFERSEIRSIPTINYVTEHVIEDWGICGTMTEWSYDCEMEFDGQYYVYYDLYLEYNDEFKFRKNGGWDVNFGAATNEYIPFYTPVEIVANGENFVAPNSGYYDLYLDPDKSVAYVMYSSSYYDDVHPASLPSGYIYCPDYDSVAALEDGTRVMVNSYVFATYGRGFIANIGHNYNNCIQVYQTLDQSMYYPVLGNFVCVFATKTTYNGLPELMDINSIWVLDYSYYDYSYLNIYDLTDPDDFVAYSSTRYDYIRYVGTLVQSGSYYNVEVEGVTSRVGSLSTPDVDLTDYIGEEVCVEGYFTGFSGTDGKYLGTVLKNIVIVNGGGSTEDVVTGPDIPVTYSRSFKNMK